ncbi:MAG: hypothetical protein HY902_07760 [Deltaproteobacteria bacterium]|nr:hypothetical protein [Deltaproteobacteria bacterium]
MPRQTLFPAVLSLVLAMACGTPAVPPAAKPDTVSDATPADTASPDAASTDSTPADVPPDAAPPASDVSASQDAGSGACMKVHPSSLDFGPTFVGDTATKNVQICNCGASALAVGNLELDGAQANSNEFNVDTGALYTKGLLANPPPVSTGNPLTLLAGQCVDVKLQYGPADVTPEAGKLDSTNLVVAADGVPNAQVVATGSGAALECPKTVFKIAEGDQVLPQTTLHLKCEAKGLPGGQAPCKWTIKQPAGSNQPLKPNDTFPNPTLQANTAGEYTICAEVAVAGLPDPCTSCVTVLVIPDNAVHVELLWDTPADPDQTDVGPAMGADLDLHFAHPMAASDDLDCDGKPDPWFSNPYDAFWFNNAPDWGKPNYQPDDATLDLDDTDGAGPENLNLEAPEGTAAEPVAYTVGVHYWNDHGYGPSYATFSLYIQGTLVLTSQKTKLNPLDMWTVGKVWWPNTASGGGKPVFEPCWQSGDSCAAKKDLMWQSSGTSCIAKCYNNNTFLAAVSGGAAAASKCP